jgi:hypothetical protein
MKMKIKEKIRNFFYFDFEKEFSNFLFDFHQIEILFQNQLSLWSFVAIFKEITFR